MHGSAMTMKQKNQKVKLREEEVLLSSLIFLFFVFFSSVVNVVSSLLACYNDCLVHQDSYPKAYVAQGSSSSLHSAMLPRTIIIIIRPLIPIKHNTNFPQANLTSVPSARSSSWYPNLGASHHVTNVSQNIHQTTPFEGPDQITIGNGQGLNMNSSSLSSFSFPFNHKIPLLLNNLLFVPSFTKI